jgi:hypothetical protein
MQVKRNATGIFPMDYLMMLSQYQDYIASDGSMTDE